MNSQFFRCKSREGVVHIAVENSYERMREDAASGVDETLCGETNYFERTQEPVNCVGCLAVEGELEE